jgi:hypothetical protein
MARPIGRSNERFPERHEADVEVLKFVEQHDEMPQIPAEAIEGGDGHEIEFTPSGIGHERIEAGAPFARAADGGVDVFADDGPTGALGVVA